MIVKITRNVLLCIVKDLLVYYYCTYFKIERYYKFVKSWPKNIILLKRKKKKLIFIPLLHVLHIYIKGIKSCYFKN